LKDPLRERRFVRMYLKRFLQNCAARFGWLALAFLNSAALLPSTVRAVTVDSDSAQCLSAPPSYADPVHVSNGCHLSTIRYLARYRSDFPGERGEPLVINMMNADRTRKMHTMALISWRGRAWCRDEFFGVFALGCRYEAQQDPGRLAALAERSYNSHARKVIRNSGMPSRPGPTRDLTPEQRLRDVSLATQLIPYPSTIYWVRVGLEELPLAFFRPANRQIAVYDPLNGTSLAECSISDDAKVVSAVAAKLGYGTGGVRCNINILSATLLTAANSPR
jgi:hypothetical protein